jgi:hypothetical protein
MSMRFHRCCSFEAPALILQRGESDRAFAYCSVDSYEDSLAWSTHVHAQALLLSPNIARRDVTI